MTDENSQQSAGSKIWTMAAKREWLSAQTGLKPNDRAVLKALVSFVGADGTCWPSLPAIHSRSGGLCFNTVRNSLRRLKAAGLFEVSRRKSNRASASSNVYKLVAEKTYSISERAAAKKLAGPAKNWQDCPAKICHGKNDVAMPKIGIPHAKNWQDCPAKNWHRNLSNETNPIASSLPSTARESDFANSDPQQEAPAASASAPASVALSAIDQSSDDHRSSADQPKASPAASLPSPNSSADHETAAARRAMLQAVERWLKQGGNATAAAFEIVENLIALEGFDIARQAVSRLEARMAVGEEIRKPVTLLPRIAADIRANPPRRDPQPRIPIGAIPLGNGRYVSRWG